MSQMMHKKYFCKARLLSLAEFLQNPPSIVAVHELKSRNFPPQLQQSSYASFISARLAWEEEVTNIHLSSCAGGRNGWREESLSSTFSIRSRTSEMSDQLPSYAGYALIILQERKAAISTSSLPRPSAAPKMFGPTMQPYQYCIWAVSFSCDITG